MSRPGCAVIPSSRFSVLNSISRRTEGPFLDFSPHVPAIARSTTVTGAVQARCIVLAVGILESDIGTKAKYIEVCTARRRLFPMSKVQWQLDTLQSLHFTSWRGLSSAVLIEKVTLSTSLARLC